MAGVAIIGLVGRLWPGWPSLAWLAVCGRVAIIGLVGRMWLGWPSLAWISRNHQQHTDGLLVKGGCRLESTPGDCLAGGWLVEP